MSVKARTPEELIEWLFDNAIPNGDCLECHLRGSLDREGRERPYIQVGGRRGKKWGVPRFVLHMKDGPLPDDIYALHSCDNPRCISLDHLFKGTAKDNTQDMMAKGRWKSDPEVGLRRRQWTWSRIKPLHEQGKNLYVIARTIGVSPNTVRAYISPKGPYYNFAFPSGDEVPVCLGLK